MAKLALVLGKCSGASKGDGMAGNLDIGDAAAMASWMDIQETAIDARQRELDSARATLGGLRAKFKLDGKVSVPRFLLVKL